MRYHGDATNAYLTTPGDRDAHILVRISCRNRTTGAVEPVGFWTGSQARDFVITGDVHTYYGAGAILNVPQITRAAGLDVRAHSIVLSRSHAAVRQMLDVKDPRHARFQMHRALFNTTTGALVAEPHLEFDGFFDVPDGTQGGSSGDELTCKFVTIIHQLTRSLPNTYSAASSQQSGDNILKYAAISGRHQVWWGEKRFSDVGGSNA